MDAAVSAERVLCDVGPELVGRDRVLTTQQLELRTRDHEMQDALHRADRAVAFGHIPEVSLHAEPHRAAVAAAFIGFAHCRYLLSTTAGLPPPARPRSRRRSPSCTACCSSRSRR